MRTNTSIVDIAQKYAYYLGQSDKFVHSNARNLGENLASFRSSNKPNLNNCTGKSECKIGKS